MLANVRLTEFPSIIILIINGPYKMIYSVQSLTWFRLMKIFVCKCLMLTSYFELISFFLSPIFTLFPGSLHHFHNIHNNFWATEPSWHWFISRFSSFGRHSDFFFLIPRPLTHQCWCCYKEKLDFDQYTLEHFLQSNKQSVIIASLARWWCRQFARPSVDFSLGFIGHQRSKLV